MYQFTQTADTDLEPGTLDLALDLIVQSGPKGLSLRSLAQKAGISASLLNYRHGSRDALAGQTFEHACDRNAALWARRAGLSTHATLRADDLPAILHAVAADTVAAGRTEALAGWICQTQAVRHGLYHGAARRWHAEGIRFWQDVLSATRLDPALAPGVSAALTGVSRIGLLGNDPVAAAWLHDMLQRMADRLLRRPLTRRGDSPWRALKEQDLPPLPQIEAGEALSTPDRIIDAAARIIVETGPDALTHRAIAERAGVSLSSTTHHFASLQDILASAFRHIYDSVRPKSDAATDLAEAKTMEALVDELAPKFHSGTYTAEREVMAMDEIMLAAARRRETQAIATGLLASVGRTSTLMLDALEDKRAETDRIDGQILRFVITGLQEAMAVSDGTLGEDWFRRHFACVVAHFYY